MAKHFTSLLGLAILRLAIVLIASPAYSESGAPPVELQDVSVGTEYIDETLACPDCGCELHGARCRHGSRCARCCCGREVCCPTVEEVTEEKSCWKVTCEKVCVPAIRLPWEPGGSKLTLFSWLRPHHATCHCKQHDQYVEDCDGCASLRAAECMPKCGPVRCVSVLASESYEVKTCQCKWEIRTLPGCCHGECCPPADDEAASAELQPAEESDLPAPVLQP